MALENILSQEIIQKLGWTLLHFVWQAAAVALLLTILLVLLRKSTANLRYIVACAALGLIVLLPIVTMQLVPVSTPQPTAGIESPPTPIIVPVQTTIEEIPSAGIVEYKEPVPPESINVAPMIPWKQRAVEHIEPALPYLVAVWLLGVFGLSLWHLGGWAQLQRLKKQMVKRVDVSLQVKLNELSGRLRVKRSVQLLKSALVQVPTVVSWLRPVILLPASALTGLTAEQLEALLAHELAHIRRHDYLINMLQTVVETLGFYHPAVWWVSHKIRIERENCCDDLAISISGDRICYARALTSMEEIRAGRSDLAVAATGGNLFERIRRLVGKDSTDSSRASWIPSVITILLIAIIAIPTILALNSQAEDKIGDGLEINAEGQQILKQMAERNRYWLIGPPAEVRHYSYDFNLHSRRVPKSLQERATGSKSIEVENPSTAEKRTVQGVTYSSVLQRLAINPSAATITKVEHDKTKERIRLDFTLSEPVRVEFGNGISGIHIGKFGMNVSGGSLWLDAKSKVPIELKAEKSMEHFSEYVEAGKSQYVPLRIGIHHYRTDTGQDYSMHFDFKFNLFGSDLWLFDQSSYQYQLGKNDLPLSDKPLVAYTSNIKINGIPRQKTDIDVKSSKAAARSDLKELDLRSQSVHDLYFLRINLNLYTRDHDGKYPVGLEALKEFTEDFPWILENVKYLGRGKTVAEPSDTIIAYDSELLNKIGGTNVLFNDSQIVFLGSEQLERLGITGRQKSDATVESEILPGVDTAGVQIEDEDTTKDQNSAWQSYLEISEALYKGANREEIAQRYLEVGNKYPITRTGRICLELGRLLEQMAIEDKSFEPPKNIESLSQQQKINYYIYKLRDVAEQEAFIPGKCRVLRYPRTPDSPAVALRKMGSVVVPAMISLMEDRRPSRSVGLSRNGGVVLRYCDIALEIIADIAGQNLPNNTTTFDPRSGRGSYLSSADEKEADEIIQRVKLWWYDNQNNLFVPVESDEGRIEGRIIDIDTGKGISGVQMVAVSNSSPASNERFACTSAEDGTFAIGGLQSGEYLLQGDFPSVDVDVVSGRSTNDVLIGVDRRKAAAAPKETTAEQQGDGQAIIGMRVIELPADAMKDVFEPNESLSSGLLVRHGHEIAGRLLTLSQERKDAKLLAGPQMLLNNNTNGTIAIIKEEFFVRNYEPIEGEPGKFAPQLQPLEVGWKFKIHAKILENGEKVHIKLATRQQEPGFETRQYRPGYDYQIPSPPDIFVTEATAKNGEPFVISRLRHGETAYCLIVTPSAILPERQPEPLLGKKLPEPDNIQNIDGIKQAKGKPALICFWDMQQRPSRNVVGELAKRENELAEKNIAVYLVHTSKIEPAKLKEWIDNQNVTFVCGNIENDADDVLFRWGVRAQPWLILTDQNGVVRAEGFGFEQLDEKLKVEESAANNSSAPVLAKSTAPSAEDKSIVKVDLSVIEVPPGSEVDRETTLEIRNLLAGKIIIPDSPAAADLLRKASEVTAAVQNETTTDKRVTQQQFDTLFDLLVSRGYVKILMNPTLEVVELQTAQIKNEQNSLEVTANAVKDDIIYLTVKADLSSQIATEGVGQKPMTSTRSFASMVSISSGQSQIIGGMIQPAVSPDTYGDVKVLQSPAGELMCIVTASIIIPAGDETQPMETVNFKNAEAKTVIEKLAAWTGKTIIPPADLMKEKITIYSPEQMPRSEAAAMILNSLRSKGYTAEQTDDTIYLKPTKEEQPGNDKDKIQIETRILTVDKDFLNDVSLDANSIFDANAISDPNAWSEHAPVVLVPPDNLGTYRLILDDLQVAFLLKATQAHKDAKMLTSPRATVQEEMPRSEAAATILNSQRSKGYTAEQSDETIFIKPLPEEQPDTGKTQIMIDTKILTVSDDFLKYIGLDPNSVASSKGWLDYLIHSSDDSASFVIDQLHADLILKALAARMQTHKDIQMLHKPQVLAMAGKKCEIHILEYEYYMLAPPSEPNGSSVESESKSKRIELGTTVRLTPNLTPDRKNVELDFEWEYRRLRGIREQTGRDGKVQKFPIVDVDRIKTPCTVPDGKTLLITGKKIIEQKKEPKKPRFSDLPLIGGLFSSPSKTEETRNLLILIKPNINPPQKAPPKPQPIDPNDPLMQPIDPNDPLIKKLEEKFKRETKPAN
jgi:beta-lactamase regulating signal transducer with metallopeptidase domain/type II secretory pathway component GspD/PulD (secretin)